jgi:hypothetical protein
MRKGIFEQEANGTNGWWLRCRKKLALESFQICVKPFLPFFEKVSADCQGESIHGVIHCDDRSHVGPWYRTCTAGSLFPSYL